MGRGPSTSRIHAFYDVHAEPDRYLGVDDTHVVVVGRYRGKARADDCEVDAAFAHIITTRGDRVAELQQITDTRRWGVAMPEEADTRNSAK